MPVRTGMGSAPASSSNKIAMIGQGIVISGDVIADSNLKVEGQIEGRGIQSSMDIEIGEPGKVVANLMARVVKMSGEVTGDVVGSEKVMITKTGRMQGNIVAPRVQLEDGSLFRGSIEMTPVQAADKKPAESKQAASNTKTAKAVPAQEKSAASSGARKEPGLTLKSG